ncbi:hypothetical protein T07_12911, partial [Trichinella nelsoni]
MASENRILSLLIHRYASHFFRDISRKTQPGIARICLLYSYYRFGLTDAHRQQQLLPGRVLTPTDFHHITNHLNQHRTKLYCSEISSKLFPDYNDRRATKRTCSNVYSHSDFSIDIDL